jgi:hypothetical protein
MAGEIGQTCCCRESDFARAVNGAEEDAIVPQIQEKYLTDATVFVAGQHKTYWAWSSNVKDVISPGTRTYPIFWGLYLEQ